MILYKLVFGKSSFQLGRFVYRYFFANQTKSLIPKSTGYWCLLVVVLYTFRPNRILVLLYPKPFLYE
jgi:hypothetical protein